MLTGTDHGGLNTGYGLNFCPIDLEKLARQELGGELLADADERHVDTSRVSDLVPVRAGVDPLPDPIYPLSVGPKVYVWGHFALEGSSDVLELVAAFAREHIIRLGIEIPEFDPEVHA